MQPTGHASAHQTYVLFPVLVKGSRCLREKASSILVQRATISTLSNWIAHPPTKRTRKDVGSSPAVEAKLKMTTSSIFS